LTEEALALGRKKVEPYFIKCGEFWYARQKFLSDPGIKKFVIPGVNTPLGLEEDPFIEAKGFKYNINPIGPPTEADRLNGFEWQGSFWVSIGVYRLSSGGRWGPWTDSTPNLLKPLGQGLLYTTFYITRFKGV
jgi:hypothetical protein